MKIKTENVIRIVAVVLIVSSIISATGKTQQTKALKSEIVAAVQDSLINDSIGKDTVFLESGLTLNPHKSDSAKVAYLTEIGYFDTLRVSDCVVVLVPKTINKLVSETLRHNADSLVSAKTLQKLTQ